MRKIILLTLIGISFLNVAAQKKFRMGLTTSPMLTWAKPKDNSVDKGKIRGGFQYGLIIDYMFQEDGNYGITTGILFSMEGGNLEPPLANSNIRLKYQYAQLPIALKLRTDRFANDKIAVYGNFGGTNGFRISSKADIKLGGVEYAEDENINKETNFGTYVVKSKLYNFQLLAGAGIEYFLSENTSLIGGLFYQHGFTNIIKDNRDSKAILSNLGLRIGLMF